MIRLEFNGKPFSPASFQEHFLKVAMEALAEEVRQKLSAIRDPDTGESPTIVVRATSMDDIRCEIEGSEQLLKLVNKRLQSSEATEGSVMHDETSTPRVFLSYAGEDEAIATAVARRLTDKGIYTIYAEWDFNAGDSLRQESMPGLAIAHMR